MRLSDGLNGVEAGGGLKGDAWLEQPVIILGDGWGED